MGRVSAEADKKATKVMRSPRRALEIEKRIGIGKAADSKNPKAASSNKRDVITP